VITDHTGAEIYPGRAGGQLLALLPIERPIGEVLKHGEYGGRAGVTVKYSADMFADYDELVSLWMVNAA